MSASGQPCLATACDTGSPVAKLVASHVAAIFHSINRALGTLEVGLPKDSFFEDLEHNTASIFINKPR